MSNETKQITLGADPELVIVDIDGAPLLVADVIPTHGSFGADGHGYIAELRPDKAITPKQIVSNVRKSLAAGLSLLNAYDWRAGPYILNKPCGGHIHVGLPDRGAPLTDSLVAAIKAIGGPVLGIVEPHEQARARRTTALRHARGGGYNNGGKPYGGIDDIRQKPYGFEWRTPSSFITRPGLSLALFAIIKAITFEELIGGKASLKRLSKQELGELMFSVEDFEECDKSIFVPMLPTVLTILKRMTYFKPGMEGSKLWSTVVSTLRKAADKDGYYIPRDIKRNWNLTTIADKVQQVVGAEQGIPQRAIYEFVTTRLIPTNEPVNNIIVGNTFEFRQGGTTYTLTQAENPQDTTVDVEELPPANNTYTFINTAATTATNIKLDMDTLWVQV